MKPTGSLRGVPRRGTYGQQRCAPWSCRRYGLCGLGGVLSILLFGAVLGAQPFTFRIEDRTVFFDDATGHASFSVPVQIFEDPMNPGFPNSTQGFSMGIRHQPGFLTALEVLQAPVLADLDNGTGPDFWGPMVVPDGVTLGVVYDFFIPISLTFENPTPVVTIEYETNAPQIGGTDFDVVTTLMFANDIPRVPGNPPVSNVVTANVMSAGVAFEHGDVTLSPTTFGPSLSRGDCNGDDTFNIADVVFMLGFLFSGGGVAPEPGCADACDGNDDGQLNIADAINTLAGLFGVTVPLPAPYPGCGPDPTPDLLDCENSPCI